MVENVFYFFPSKAYSREIIIIIIIINKISGSQVQGDLSKPINLVPRVVSYEEEREIELEPWEQGCNAIP